MNSRIGVRGLSAMALVLAFVTVLLAVPASMPVSLARDATPGIDPSTLYSHVHFIGASATAGFGVRAPLARGRQGRLEQMTLANVALSARVVAGAVTGDATALFFANPIPVGTAQVDGALAENPKATLVVADDFLFWFCYGALGADRTPIKDEAQRLALLNKGLEQLDRVVAAGIPLVVGDLPDMQAAVGKMLTPKQMPRKETLAKANERIRTWAQDKPRVAVMPLSKLLVELRSGKPFEAGRRSWSAETDGDLLQRDELHPTFAGSVALVARTEQAANERFLGVRQPNAPGAPTAFEHDPAKVLARLRETMGGGERAGEKAARNATE